MNKGFYWLAAIVVVGLIFAGLSLNKETPATTDSVGETESTQPKEDSPPEAANEATEEPTAPKPATHEVSYNGSSFSSSNLTINAGDTVRFTNSSSSLMWVASDPHPTHTNFASFDSNQGVGQGQTYNFTFAKAGTFGFHNHLNSSHTGTITVK